MKPLHWYAIAATVVAIVLAGLLWQKGDQLDKADKAIHEADSLHMLTKIDMAVRDTLLSRADRYIEALERDRATRRPTRDRVNDRFNLLEGAAVDSLYSILDADLPTIR